MHGFMHASASGARTQEFFDLRRQRPVKMVRPSILTDKITENYSMTINGV